MVTLPIYDNYINRGPMSRKKAAMGACPPPHQKVTPGSAPEINYNQVINKIIYILGSAALQYATWWQNVKTSFQLMVNENLIQRRKDEIYLLVMQLDRLFRATAGQKHRHISLYEPFDSERSVIFPSETEFLELKLYTSLQSRLSESF